MIGKSYDGTLANGVAATGVDGLKTIVPISAISAWYNYSRTGGVRHNTNYPGGSLNPRHHDRSPNRRPASSCRTGRRSARRCRTTTSTTTPTSTPATATRTATSTQFWRERDYNKDVSKVKAAVFAIHGFQDDNVRMDHLGLWWEGLKANNVPRKLWLLRTGHTDPFEQRRTEWVNTLHRWFDYWLYSVAERDHERARRHDRGREGHLGQLRRVAGPRDPERRPVPARARPPRPARWRAWRAAASPTRRPTRPTAPTRTRS